MPVSSGAIFARDASNIFCSLSAPAMLPSCAKATPRAKCNIVVDNGPGVSNLPPMMSFHRPNRSSTLSESAEAPSIIGIIDAIFAAFVDTSSAASLACLKSPIIAYDVAPKSRLWL